MDSSALIDGLVFYLVFLFSTTLHEAAHAWAAKQGGDLTAYLGGQVSLDPLPHIRREPFGMVVLPVLSVLISGWPFGYASAPYDRHWAVRHPRRAAWMALAGPGANLALIIAAAIVIKVGFAGGWLTSPDAVSFSRITAAAGAGPEAIAFVVSVVFSLNLVLFVLNLIPVPPLDGSGALPLLMSARLTARYQEFIWSQPMFSWIGILVAWRIFGRIFHPLWLAAVNLIYPGISYS
jgi:Zn-dependent protease